MLLLILGTRARGIKTCGHILSSHENFFWLTVLPKPFSTNFYKYSVKKLVAILELTKNKQSQNKKQKTRKHIYHQIAGMFILDHYLKAIITDIHFNNKKDNQKLKHGGKEKISHDEITKDIKLVKTNISTE